MNKMRETGVFIEGKHGANFFSTTEAAWLHRRAAEVAEDIDGVREVTNVTVNDTLKVLAGLRDESAIRPIATRLLQNALLYENGQPVIREDLQVAILPYRDGDNRITAKFDYELGRVTQIECLADGSEMTVLLLSQKDRVEGPKDVSGAGWQFRFDSTDDSVIFASNPAKDVRVFRDIQVLSGPPQLHIWAAPGALSAR